LGAVTAGATTAGGSMRGHRDEKKAVRTKKSDLNVPEIGRDRVILSLSFLGSSGVD
jgi:hypothetical protein